MRNVDTKSYELNIIDGDGCYVYEDGTLKAKCTKKGKMDLTIIYKESDLKLFDHTMLLFTARDANTKLLPLVPTNSCVSAYGRKQSRTVWAECKIPEVEKDPKVENACIPAAQGWIFGTYDPDCKIKIIIKTEE